LDEATSALDEVTEGLVMESIKRIGLMKTIIMVTHRKASLKNCTKIIEFKKGSINRVCSYYEFINNEHCK
jgi:ABC-type bacteriocin/lantibiotic exporter with double-glycine peptidase domain